MRKSRFSDTQILAAIKQVEGGRSVVQVCASLDVTTSTFYGWRAKYGAVTKSAISTDKAIALMTRLKEREAEGARLKKLQRQEYIKAELLKEAQAERGAEPKETLTKE